MKDLLSYTDSVYNGQYRGFMDTSTLTELMRQKEQILSRIASLPDFRPGSLVERFRQAMSELVETNIRICDTKLDLEKVKQDGSEEAEKRG